MAKKEKDREDKKSPQARRGSSAAGRKTSKKTDAAAGPSSGKKAGGAKKKPSKAGAKSTAKAGEKDKKPKARKTTAKKGTDKPKATRKRTPGKTQKKPSRSTPGAASEKRPAARRRRAGKPQAETAPVLQEAEIQAVPADLWPQGGPLGAVPAPPQSGFLAMGAPIPSHYGEDRLGCLVRDPNWIHCYWELEGGTCQRIADERGQDFLDSCRWVIRMMWGEGNVEDIYVDPLARNWHVRVRPRTRYTVELGIVTVGGQYIRLLSGNEVETPPRSPSEAVTPAAMRPIWQLEELMALWGVGSSPAGSRSGSERHQVRIRVLRERAGEAGAGLQKGRGQLVFVFHSHLPYVRHPEHERFLEEEWLFEAITETYVPLAKMLSDLEGEGIRARAAIGVSPPLCEMLSDPMLQNRYRAQLDRLIECADRALENMKGTGFEAAAQMYCERLHKVRSLYDSWGRNPLNPLKDLQRKGTVEIVTCAGTHGLLPLMKRRESVYAQIETGCRNYEKHFGTRPLGMWLPESAYRSELDSVLASCGIKYIFVESHGVLFGTPQPQNLTYMPVVTPDGIVAFPRDPFTGVQVWSSEQGYPGDPVYREFYRDLGYDGDFETVKECLEPDGRRRNIGLKYHRVTGRVSLDAKEPYIPQHAKECAASHANHFVEQCERRVHDLADGMGNGPVLCAMYDTELFGHWWFEGIDFLESVYRRIARSEAGLLVSTPSEVLAAEDMLQSVTLCASTWGVNGYYEHWVNASNSWIYPHLHKAEDRMVELAARFPGASGLRRRALNQAARELQLAQASDWAFLIAARSAPEYATRRTRDHIAQFTRIYDMLVSDRVDESELQQIEQRDSIFSEMDYEVYASPLAIS